jgi:transcriptional regulator with XRE-family HTH domain
VNTVNAKKRVALELAGWRFEDAADFLEMSHVERQLLDARVEAALAVRRQRHALKLSQKELASRIKTSQPRVAKIERAAPDVSLDQILRAFAAAGGRITIRPLGQSPSTKKASGSSRARGKKLERRKEKRPDEVQIELVSSVESP